MADGIATFASDLESIEPSREHLVQDRCGPTNPPKRRMGLAPDFSLTFDGGRLPQSAATLGVDVGSFVRHLSQP